jgi:DNA-binding MarR family transcriptional regulator
MGLEQDINQKIFSSEIQKAMLNIIYTSNWLQGQSKVIFDTENITNQQYNILRILRGAKSPLSTLQIRERMLDKMSDTSRIVDRLLLKKLVVKCPCPSDKRLVDISITTEGMALLERLDKNPAIDGGFCNSLTAAEAQTLNQLLDKLRS